MQEGISRLEESEVINSLVEAGLFRPFSVVDTVDKDIFVDRFPVVSTGGHVSCEAEVVTGECDLGEAQSCWAMEEGCRAV